MQANTPPTATNPAGPALPPGVESLAAVRFGPSLLIERYRLDNGLDVLLCEDHSAPVLAYHTWYRVGSRHEKVGKTGLAHLFEHLMFNETEKLPAGAFDQQLEEAGADSNAATWLDWTQYTVAVPSDQLELVVDLEAERMANLVLRDPQVDSEKEVVANERRYRVDDDVEGAVTELLYKTAFTTHAYGWPTIGWMADIEGFTTADCEAFYASYYAPNNATLVVVGDVTADQLLPLVKEKYGQQGAGKLPLEDGHPEPAQHVERRVETSQPTSTQKLMLGYHGPAVGDFDHPAVSVLAEVLFGGRASRVYQRLITDLEIASEVRVFVGPFRDPGLIEVYASARGEVSAERLLEELESEFARVQDQAVSEAELRRARSRLELGLVASLESVDGKANTIGFYETVLGRPDEAFSRMDAIARVSAGDLLRVARRYLLPGNRSVVLVRASEASK